MNTLNLINKAKSFFDYEISSFPDGQQQVNIWNKHPHNISAGHIEIVSRLNNWMDLEIIVCATKALNNLGTKSVSLYCPYFLGSRSDRKFYPGSTNYLKDVICPVINSLGFTEVLVMDSHSDVLEACLNNYTPLPISSFYSFVFDTPKDFILMSPDAGALKKIYKTAQIIGHEGDIITCEKMRTVSGQIIHTNVPHFDITKDVYVVDDICDGGKTFIEIAKVIRERYENYDREKSDKDHGKLYLVVTHGIFSKGFKELKEYFEAIYTTNSYRDFEDPASEFVMREKGIQIVKQFNLF